jgi:hypothetical protein
MTSLYHGKVFTFPDASNFLLKVASFLSSPAFDDFSFLFWFMLTFYADSFSLRVYSSRFELSGSPFGITFFPWFILGVCRAC